MVDDSLRLADLLAGLSLISDHGLGLAPDNAVRSCLVATALARKLDLHESEVGVSSTTRCSNTSAAPDTHTTT